MLLVHLWLSYQKVTYHHLFLDLNQVNFCQFFSSQLNQGRFCESVWQLLHDFFQISGKKIFSRFDDFFLQKNFVNFLQEVYCVFFSNKKYEKFFFCMSELLTSSDKISLFRSGLFDLWGCRTWYSSHKQDIFLELNNSKYACCYVKHSKWDTGKIKWVSPKILGEIFTYSLKNKVIFWEDAEVEEIF